MRLLIALTFCLFGLLGCASPAPETKSKPVSPLEAEVVAFESQFSSEEGLRTYLDPTDAAKNKAFSWDPTGRSTNQILFKLRQTKIDVHDRAKLLVRCLLALSQPTAEKILAASPEPKGKERLASVLMPASELLDELRGFEVAPKGALLAKDTIDFYLGLTPKGSHPQDQGGPATASELSQYNELRQRWAKYAADYRLPY